MDAPKRYWVVVTCPDGWAWFLKEESMPWWRRLLWRMVIGGEWRRAPS